MPFANPQYLVETDWLAAHLDDPNLRVLECTVFLRRDEARGMRIESGRAAWEEGHIPGSAFADLPHDLSDRDAALRFMMPSAAQFADAMASYGVGNDSQVVLYDRALSMWAARIWWMLRAMGFDRAAVLNGGWSKWTAEDRPVSSDPPASPRGVFHARPQPELFADKAAVLAAIDDGAICLINALAEEQHTGQTAPYGRPGHIPRSANVPAMGPAGVVDPATQCYRSPEALQRLFADVGATTAGRVITYCGGGIAASSDALALTLLGHNNVAVYDASMSEWAADPGLPLETG